MTIEYDEKGKIFTDIVSKVAIYATVQTTMHMLRGRIHVRRDQRIIDELDINENFIAITDVTVLGADGQTLFRYPFWQCAGRILFGSSPNKNQVRRINRNGYPAFIQFQTAHLS